MKKLYTQRMDENIISRIEAVATAQKSYPRAVMEALIEKGLPELEAFYGINSSTLGTGRTPTAGAAALDELSKPVLPAEAKKLQGPPKPRQHRGKHALVKKAARHPEGRKHHHHTKSR